MSGLSGFLNVADFSLSWLSVQRFHSSIGGHKLANPLTANIKSLMMSDFLDRTSKGVCLTLYVYMSEYIWPCKTSADVLYTTVNEKLMSHIHWHPPLSSFHLFSLISFSPHSLVTVLAIMKQNKSNLYHAKWRCPSMHSRMIDDVEVGDFFGNTGKNI
jgi:hypothetical protein